MTFDELPDVIPDAVLAAFFGRTVRTIQMKRKAGTWPIPELRDQKCRTAKVQVERYLAGSLDTRPRLVTRRRSA